MVHPAKKSPTPRKRMSTDDAATLADAIRIREEHERSIVEAGWTDPDIEKIGADAMASPEGRQLIEDIRAAREQDGKTKLRAVPRRIKRTGGP